MPEQASFTLFGIEWLSHTWPLLGVTAFILTSALLGAIWEVFND